MSIRFDSAVLVTEKLEEMKQFYTGALGQRVRFDFGNCVALECGLTLWALKDEYPITRALGARYHETPNRNLEICFDTDDFALEAKRIKALDIALLHDVSEETWGQMTIRFYDPDHNIVELGESMRCFSRRLHAQGLDVTAVAEKTGIPLSTVQEYLDD